MIKRLIIAAVSLIGTSSTAEPVYNCSVLDVAVVGDQGLFASSDYTELVQNSQLAFTFDVSTGLYTQDSIQWHFNIVQFGSSENSLKAIRQISGPATVVLQYLNIDTFSDNRFLFAWGSEVWSGFCFTSD